MRATSLAILLLSIFTFCPADAATTRYVRANGNDSYCTGTTDAAWNGVASANQPCAKATFGYWLMSSRVSRGDTFLVHGGTYEDASIITMAFGAGDGGYVTVQAYPGETVNWAINNNGHSRDLADGIRFIDINFTNPYNKTTYGLRSQSAAITATFDGGSYATTTYCPIRSVSTASNATWIFNNFKINVLGDFFITASSSACKDTISFSSSEIQNIASLINTSKILELSITNSTVVKPTDTVVKPGVSPSSFIHAYNNIVVLNSNKSFISVPDTLASAMISDPTKWDVENNIFWTTDTGVNLNYQDFNNIILTTGYYLPIDKSNRFVDPMFVDYAAGNYKLSAASKISARGNAEKLPTGGDLEKVAWNGADVGAYSNPSNVIQRPSLVPESVAWVGDSIMAGWNATDQSTTCDHCAWKVFGDLNPSLSVTGGDGVSSFNSATAQGCQWIVDYVAWKYAPETIVFACGINEIAYPHANQTNAQVAKEIITGMEKITDFGIAPIWIGTESVYGNPPDNTNGFAVNSTVDDFCTVNGIKHGSTLDVMIGSSSAWEADYYVSLAADMHPNNAGQRLMAGIASNLYNDKDFTVVKSDNSMVANSVCNGDSSIPCVSVFPSVVGTKIYNITALGLSKAINLRSNAIIKNSLLYYNTVDINADGGVATTANNWFSSDPSPMINSDGFLLNNSPLIGAGAEVGLKVDADGNPSYPPHNIGAKGGTGSGMRRVSP